MFHKHCKCYGCVGLSFVYPRSVGKTKKEYEAAVKKVEDDPYNIAYKGKREHIECVNKDFYERTEKLIYELEKNLGVEPSIHGRGGTA